MRPQNSNPKILDRKRRPPAFETLVICLLRSLQFTCLFATVIYMIYGINGKWPDFWLVVGVFGAHFASFYRGIWLEESFRPNHLFVALSETLALVVFIRVMAFFAGYNSSLLDLYFTLDMFVISIAWLSGRGYSGNYFYLHVQPYELAEEDEAVFRSLDTERINFDHAKSYSELGATWKWSLGLEIGAILLAIPLGDYYGTIVPQSEYRANILLIGAIGLLIGIPLQALLRLRFLRTGWRVDRLKEPARLPTRWNFYLLALLALAFVAAFGLAWLGSSGILRVPNISLDNKNGQQNIVDDYSILAPPPTKTVPPVEGEETSKVPAFLQALWLLLNLLVLSALVAGIIYFAIIFLIKAGWVSPRWREIKLKVGWNSLLSWLKSLFGSRRLREGFEKELTEDSGRLNLLRRFFRERIPDNPRGQIRYHYRHMSERAGRAGYFRGMGDTPHEYEEKLAPVVLEAELQPELDKISRLYEKARYSPYPLDELAAGAAKHHAESLSTFFKRKQREKKQNPQKPS
ncbi:MAG: DUF4129 domain-containing protein [Chloroflexi bacterium]|uniref:DUF4129 domain-containing protein n=1 Tax=Candidatus Chlorohelix allophototropha TaxID=3003348 RepID=A0A8T7LY63_9CHLR|nr:DUF4129 domain-containing protein [Chloroflexota bacterium]WJW67804.1 DUF4129 domain-containing protein [Chloroflexota bacterium L227-S17]